MSIGVAIVTGSAQGIGRAISLRLADDGFDVAVNDISSKQAELESLVEQIKAKGRKSHMVTADVSQEEQVKDMIESTVKNLGGLDVVRISFSTEGFVLMTILGPDGRECGNKPLGRLHY